LLVYNCIRWDLNSVGYKVMFSLLKWQIS
jgi:hypothetical protein